MSNAIKIPKKIAGIKIPKTLRKGAVGQFLNSSGGQLLIAEAVAVAIATLALRRTASGERAGTVIANRAAELGASAQQSVQGTSARLTEAIRAGIHAFRDTLQNSVTDDALVEEPAGNPDEEGPAAKKRSASGAKGAAAH